MPTLQPTAQQQLAEGVYLAQLSDQPVLLLPAPEGEISPCDPNRAELAPLLGECVLLNQRYLVYGWKSGELLSRRLARGAFPRLEAVKLIQKLLDGAAHASLLGYGYGPLLPSHIVLDVMDQPCWATVMPRPLGRAELINATGALLHQLLTRQTPQRDAQGQLIPPSKLTGDMDVRLELIIRGALGESGAPIYRHVLDLRAALTDYLDELAALDSQDDSPADRLIHTMAESDDFPALSRAIGAINRITSADGEKLQTLAAIILRDFSLTNKVLRQANSASYGQFGGNISTVSRAVLVLGFEPVKAIALSLTLLEHLHNRAQATDLREEVERTFFASVISRKLAEKCRYRELEEARVAGMFHLLGRMLAHFYFAADAAEISQQVLRGAKESVASTRQLGVSYEQLGHAVGRRWNLPDKLICSIQTERDKPHIPANDGEHLRLYANAGAELMNAILGSEAQSKRAFSRVCERFGDALKLNELALRQLVDEAARECLTEAPVFGLEAQAEGTLARLRQMLGLPAIGSKPATGPAQDALVLPPSGSTSAGLPAEGQDRAEVVATLTTGIQELTDTLVGEYQLNDLLRMVLETLQRALGAERVLLATRSVQRNALIGRFGFGKRVDVLLHAFSVPLSNNDDVLRSALLTNHDVLINDIDQFDVRNRIPAWYRQPGFGRSMLLLPLVIDRKPVGMLFVDHAQAGSLKLGAREISLLKTLRNQALLAIRQKTPIG